MSQSLDPLTLRRAQRGDRTAQELFLRRYVGAVHALVRRSGTPGDADDLTQELLQKLLIALPRFDPSGPAQLTTWVFTVAQRWLIDRSRRRQHTFAPLEEGAAVADVRPIQDALLAGRQLQRALEQAIATLPVDQRRVFLLAHVHQQPLKEIAEGEGVALGTVKSRIHRARVALMQLLSDAEEPELEKAKANGGGHDSRR
jgi:RNA polymerase sigma-70 factor (ECF subfamily)